MRTNLMNLILNTLIETEEHIDKIKLDLCNNLHNKDYVNKQDQFGLTALNMACASGHFLTANLLLDHPEIDINLVDNYGRTAEEIIFKYFHPEQTKLCESLKKARDLALEKINSIKKVEECKEFNLEYKITFNKLNDSADVIFYVPGVYK